MAIYFGNNYKRGKVGSSVFARRGNVLIEKAYNPFIKNPQTVLQRVQRTRFKNVTLLGSIIGGKNMAYGYLGNKSAVNEFVKRNIGLVTSTIGAGESVSTVLALSSVKLTDSSKYAGAVTLTPTVFEVSKGAEVKAEMPSGYGFDNYTVVVLGSTTPDLIRSASELMFIGKVEVNEGDTASILVPKATENLFNRFFVYAYGYSIDEDTMNAKYGDLVANIPEDERVSVITQYAGGVIKTNTSTTMYGSVQHSPVS